MDEALAQLSRERLTKAAHDLQAARIVGAAPDGPLDMAIFHCQQAAENLTRYASAFRYPGVTQDPMPSREEFDAAVQHAQSIYDFVLDLLPVQARP